MTIAYIKALLEMFPSRAKWSVNDLPDQTGHVAIVTGGNTGIGKAICEVLLQKNARVYLMARSEDKALEAIRELKEKTNNNNVHYIKLDLGDLSTINGTVEEFKKKESQLHLLFNNAGVMFPPNGSKTVQGYELQLGTNGLGHVLLTNLLLPTLISTSKSEKVKAEVLAKGYNIVRIINTSSNAHVCFPPKGGFNWKDPNFGFKDPQGSYGQSKFLNVIHAFQLAKILGKDGISSHSLNPGAISSDLHRHGSWLYHIAMYPITYSIDYGRMTPLFAGLSEEAGAPSQNGSYYIPWGRKSTANPDVHNEENVTKIMDWVQKQVAPFE